MHKNSHYNTESYILHMCESDTGKLVKGISWRLKYTSTPLVNSSAGYLGMLLVCTLSIWRKSVVYNSLKALKHEVGGLSGQSFVFIKFGIFWNLHVSDP